MELGSESRSSTTQPSGSFEVKRSGTAELTIAFSGRWVMSSRRPQTAEIEDAIGKNPGTTRVCLKAENLTGWDGSLTSALFKLVQQCHSKKISVVQEELPEGLRRLLALALAVPEKQGARRQADRRPWLEKIGAAAVKWGEGGRETLEFVGETSVACFRFAVRQARLPRGQLGVIIQENGPAALPIVTLISMLVGLILAFIGAIQLRQFGAQIYVANLVGIAMVREMGAIMAGIILAGRTGAAFAAQLGTMQVNDEIDALKTLGISATEFLVLPRMLALILMTPLLCLYADFMGIAGGFIVGVGVLNISFTQFYQQTSGSFAMTDVWVGVVKGLVFGVLVAFTGCMRGMHCGRSAASVGQAVTSAVVLGIVCIVVTDAIFAVITNILGV